MGFQFFVPDAAPHDLQLQFNRITRPDAPQPAGETPPRPRRLQGHRRNEGDLFYTIAGNETGRRAIRLRLEGVERCLLAEFRRNVTTAPESSLLDGLIALAGDTADRQAHATALPCFEAAREIADAEWLSAMLHLRMSDYSAAEHRFRNVLGRVDDLGATFEKFGIEAVARFPISNRVSAYATPQTPGTLLGLIGVYHHSNRPRDALDRLEELLTVSPADPVVRLYFAELVWRTGTGNEASMRRLIDLTADIENDSPIGTALLLYRARALGWLRLHQTALHTLTNAMRRPKGRPPGLLQEVHFQRAMTYAARGNVDSAMMDLKRLLAKAPGFTKARQALHNMEAQ
ncbi:hypothetical protein [Fodinicurvata sp. EGI_FJ10296]|uniref:hypothetical protein n=1 Tax=Fodinicurvata sp. EGI_FJ10296 TaxID=3231908 RepID=UPI003453BB5B